MKYSCELVGLENVEWLLGSTKDNLKCLKTYSEGRWHVCEYYFV